MPASIIASPSEPKRPQNVNDEGVEKHGLRGWSQIVNIAIENLANSAIAETLN